ncbi:MAG: helix-turn-helix transcriptional regulator [Burkholderiales bacterium]
MTIIIGVKTNKEMLREIGARLKAYRLQQNISQHEMAKRAGLNRNTVVSAELGVEPKLSTLIKILRVLDRLESLESFLPPPPLSPMSLIKTRGRERKRARRGGGDG